MAIQDAFEEIFEGNVGTGLAVVLGVAILAPLLRPLVGSIVRPAAKAAIRGGVYAYDALAEAAAATRDAAGTAVAEARHERSTTGTTTTG